MSNSKLQLRTEREELLQLLMEMDRRLARRSLAEFLRQAWTVLYPSRPLVWSWYLDAICIHLEAVFHGAEWARRLTIAQPPNTLKSTIANVCFPAWVWANDPTVRFLCASNDGPLATRDAIAMRDLITSDWYRSSFQPSWRLRMDQDQKTWFNNTAGGHRISYSVRSRVTGKKGDILLVDDANDARKVTSEVERAADAHWYNESFSGRVANEVTSPIVICGQRLHVQDLIGHVHRQGGWTELRLSEEYDPNHHCRTPIWSDPRTEPGEWLRPDRFGPVQKAERLGVLGTRGYLSQHQQLPTEAEGGLFKRQWFKLVESSQRLAQRVRYWDRAATEDGGKYSCGVLLSKDQRGQIVVEDVQRARLSAHARNELIRQTAQLDRARYGAVTIVGEGEPGSAGKEVSEQFVAMLAGFVVKVDRVTGSKVDRAAPLAAQAEAGNVYVLNREWAGAYIDELSSFPDGLYSDQVDASSGAFNTLAPLTFRPVIGSASAGQGRLVDVPDDAFR